MTAKQKSEELIKKYISTYKRWDIEYLNLKNIKELKKELFQLEWFIPKECALIAIEELIYETQFEVPNIRQRYWQEVKQEIEKL